MHSENKEKMSFFTNDDDREKSSEVSAQTVLINVTG